MFLTIAGQAFEAGDFLYIFLKFCGFWGSFPYKKTFLYKKNVYHFVHGHQNWLGI